MDTKTFAQEWQIEELDEHGEIVDTHGFDHLNDALAFADSCEAETTVALCRTYFVDEARYYAYATDAGLPSHFASADDRKTSIKVPARLLREWDSRS